MYRMKSFLFCGKNMCPKISIFPGIVTIHSRKKKNMRDAAERKAEFRAEKKKISTGLPEPCKWQEH